MASLIKICHHNFCYHIAYEGSFCDFHRGLTHIDWCTPDSTIRVSLHTSDPGLGGEASLNETGYHGYARQAVDTGEWRTKNGVVSNGNKIAFPQCTSMGSTIRYIAVSKDDHIVYSGPLDSPIHVDVGMSPEIPKGLLKIQVSDG